MSFLLGILLQGFQLEGSCRSPFRKQPLLYEELDFGAEEVAVDVVLLLPQPGEEGGPLPKKKSPPKFFLSLNFLSY